MKDQLAFEDEMNTGLPGGINVLTILTFIGSSIGLLFMAAYPWILKFSLSMMDKAASSGRDFTAKQLADMEKSRKDIELAQANIVPIIIVSVAGCILCIIGAIMMRKLKKDGYTIYVIGEILPVIAGFILMGSNQTEGIMKILISLALPVLFIALYTFNRKHLIN